MNIGDFIRTTLSAHSVLATIKKGGTKTARPLTYIPG
jgi:hypothetical protein